MLLTKVSNCGSARQDATLKAFCDVDKIACRKQASQQPCTIPRDMQVTIAATGNEDAFCICSSRKLERRRLQSSGELCKRSLALKFLDCVTGIAKPLQPAAYPDDSTSAICCFPPQKANRLSTFDKRPKRQAQAPVLLARCVDCARVLGIAGARKGAMALRTSARKCIGKSGRECSVLGFCLQ